MVFERLKDEDFAHLTTTGRTSGSPHRIEIWFAIEDGRLYLLSGGGDRADWVKNIRRTERSAYRSARAASRHAPGSRAPGKRTPAHGGALFLDALLQVRLGLKRAGDADDGLPLML